MSQNARASSSATEIVGEGLVEDDQSDRVNNPPSLVSTISSSFSSAERCKDDDNSMSNEEAILSQQQQEEPQQGLNILNAVMKRFGEQPSPSPTISSSPNSKRIEFYCIVNTSNVDLIEELQIFPNRDNINNKTLITTLKRDKHHRFETNRKCAMFTGTYDDIVLCETNQQLGHLEYNYAIKYKSLTTQHHKKKHQSQVRSVKWRTDDESIKKKYDAVLIDSTKEEKWKCLQYLNDVYSSSMMEETNIIEWVDTTAQLINESNCIDCIENLIVYYREERPVENQRQRFNNFIMIASLLKRYEFYVNNNAALKEWFIYVERELENDNNAEFDEYLSSSISDKLGQSFTNQVSQYLHSLYNGIPLPPFIWLSIRALFNRLRIEERSRQYFDQTITNIMYSRNKSKSTTATISTLQVEDNSRNQFFKNLLIKTCSITILSNILKIIYVNQDHQIDHLLLFERVFESISDNSDEASNLVDLYVKLYPTVTISVEQFSEFTLEDPRVVDERTVFLALKLFNTLSDNETKKQLVNNNLNLFLTVVRKESDPLKILRLWSRYFSHCKHLVALQPRLLTELQTHLKELNLDEQLCPEYFYNEMDIQLRNCLLEIIRTNHLEWRFLSHVNCPQEKKPAYYNNVKSLLMSVPQLLDREIANYKNRCWAIFNVLTSDDTNVIQLLQLLEDLNIQNAMEHDATEAQNITILNTISEYIDQAMEIIQSGKCYISVMRLLSHTEIYQRLKLIFNKIGKSIVQLEEIDLLLENMIAFDDFVLYFKQNFAIDIENTRNRFKSNRTMIRECFSVDEEVEDCLNSNDIQTINRFSLYKSSRVFIAMHQEALASTNSCGGVVAQHWQCRQVLDHCAAVEIQYNEFVNMMVDESLNVWFVYRYFGDLDEEEIKEEINTISNSLEIDLIITAEKISFLFNLNQCQILGEILLNMFAIFSISNSMTMTFQTFRQILDSNRNDIDLKSITEEMLRYKEIFRIWTQNENIQTAMKAFVECSSLQTWIQQHIMDITEFKKFISLAITSVADNDAHKERILEFRASVMAYSGFLFCFNLSERFGYQNLKDSFELLKSELDHDQDLPEKLKLSNRMKDWFAQVYDYTSMERSTLSLLLKIVNSGRLNIRTHSITVSFRENNDDDDDENKTEDNNDEELLDWKALLEFESKLTLAVLKKQKHHKKEIFMSVMRQAKLIKESLDFLCTNGCMLFKEFSMTGYFNSNESNFSVIMDFHNSKILKGKRNLVDDLEEILTFLNTCQTEWPNYISQMREKYDYLNYFSNIQLDTLCHFCVNVQYDTRDYDHSLGLTLFKMISRDITLEDVREVVRSQEFNNDDEKDKEEENSSSIKDCSPVVTEDAAAEEQKSSLDSNSLTDLEIFVQASLQKVFFDEKCLYASIIANDMQLDEDNIFDWCIQNPEKMATWDEISSRLNNSDKCSPNQQNQLFENLMSNWNDFLKLKSVNRTFTLSNLNATIKSLLTKKSTVNENSCCCRRSLPICLKEGQPNLMIVKECNILSTILMIYSQEELANRPGLDEILLCNKNTSFEQIDLICRRALKDTTGKIYTLGFAERMNLDCATKLKEILFNYNQNRRYRLLFIVSQEHSRNSRIADLLKKYKVTQSMEIIDELISSYLCAQLQNKSTLTSSDDLISLDRYQCRVISSRRYGEGKSTLSKRMSEDLKLPRIVISIHSVDVNIGDVIASLYAKYRRSKEDNNDVATIFHFNITSNKKTQYDELLFSLCLMSGLRDNSGNVWICSSDDFYTFEITRPARQQEELERESNNRRNNDFVNFLPTIWCKSPAESLLFYQSVVLERGFTTNRRLQIQGEFICHFMDATNHLSEEFQRPAQYFSQSSEKTCCDSNFVSQQDCLSRILNEMSNIFEDPTWLELTNFCKFFNLQLKSFENSVYCQSQHTGDVLPGFRKFVFDLILEMSKDFATRSATISDESFNAIKIKSKSRWERVSHPYLFFHQNQHTLSFFGFKITDNGHLLNDKGDILLENVMPYALYNGLRAQKIDFRRDLSLLKMKHKELRDFYLSEICKIVGIPKTEKTGSFDLDYELTSDNVLKMLAIYTRSRAGIPTIIIGETGVGKTRLIQFMCNLLKQDNQLIRNLSIVKCHGGMSDKDIYRATNKAIELAKHNSENGFADTFLFFDEANSTQAVGAVKEIICDGMLDGEPIPDDIGLKFIAAMNPFKKHSDKMIKKLENAGLGYRVRGKNSLDKFGNIPMRQLVYRVQESPPSFASLVWDFGTLTNETEEKYIGQMVENFLSKFQQYGPFKDILVAVFSKCQQIMRNKDDECFYVSLRDVKRCLTVLHWFADKEEILQFHCADDGPQIPSFYQNLIFTIAFNYYVRLENRDHFFRELLPIFNKRSKIFQNESEIIRIIAACQQKFLENVSLPDSNISKNEALTENVWMMVICIELKIPLFLIGKPGTSKSLAKTIVSDVLNGKMSDSQFYKNFKYIDMVSFQCNELTTSENILATFRQCVLYQKQGNYNSSAVVVLDEIGLAEDSKSMPLKILHPLLENGSLEDSFVDDDRNLVAFIGISNWALDPAKMNRGVFISRPEASKQELIKTIAGFTSEHELHNCKLKTILEEVTDGYLEVYRQQQCYKPEYYGLRDLYSLVKLIISRSCRNDGIDARSILECAVRTFGGAFGSFNPISIFLQKMSSFPGLINDIHPLEVVRLSFRNYQNCRYNLLLTKNYAALNALLESDIIQFQETTPTLIFGSYFPLDQEYVNVCKIINQIKLAMEKGEFLILCDLSRLYESLYDVLNQFYMKLGNCRYVDLGLGTHRVKCQVHDNFRLVIVAEDTDVFESFPPPLINRLEKHFLDVRSLLTEESLEKAQQLDEWMHRFAHVERETAERFKAEDVFIGYYEDLAATVVQNVTTPSHKSEATSAKIMRKHFLQELLLNCVSPESVLRLESSHLASDERKEVEQICNSLPQKSLLTLIENSLDGSYYLQVTTFTRIQMIENLLSEATTRNWRSDILILEHMKTEDEFRRHFQTVFSAGAASTDPSVLIIKYIFNETHEKKFLDSVRFCIRDVCHKFSNFCVLLLVQIPRYAGTTLARLPASPWNCYHIDEVNPESQIFNIFQIKDYSVYEVLNEVNELAFSDLLKESVHNSCCILAAGEKRDQPNTKRQIRILTNILDINNKDCYSKQFVSILRKMIICKLQQQEKDDEEEEGDKETKKSSWLKELAHNSNYLAEGHNFQETIWLSLKKEIEGPFSVVIESVDINDGLDHLSENSHPKRELFIQSVEHIDMASFECASAMAKKLIVSGSCSLPFSWLLKSIIDEIYDQRCETPIYRSLMKKDIFKVSNAYFLQYSEDAWTSAARDLILFEYSEFKDHVNIIAALSQKVIDFAQKHSDEWKRDDNDYDSFHSHHRALTFADLYLSFQKIKSDFNVLSEVVPIFNRLKLLTNNNSSFNKILEIRTTSNSDFNVLNYSTSLLLDSLNWKHYDLTDVSVKAVWVECVTRSQIIFNKYHHQSQSYPHWEQQDRQFKSLERLALFVQHVVRNYEGISTSGQRLYNFKPIFVKALNTIQIYFKRLYLVKSEDEFNLLLNCLHSISVDAGNGLFFNQNKKCFWCGGAYKDPVCPPCRHIACRKCFVDIIAGRTQNGKIWRCPYTGCLEEYQQDIDLQQATEECEINDQYNRFKSDLGIFLLESLEKFSFSLKCLPHHEILNKLISLRLYNEENASNPISLSKISSNLQENYLRETPAVKTAVLQMCLQTNWEETMLFLNNYVKDNERKIDTHFFLFVLKAMEDSLRIKSMKSLTFKEDLVTENCHFYSELLTHGTDNTPNWSVVECLEFTAKIKLSIRFALSIICSFLKNIPLSTKKEHFLSQVEACIVESDDPDCLKQFAMNEMLRLYGRQSLLSWIQKKFHLNLLTEKVLTKEALQIDYFLTIGNEYLKIKASLVEIISNKRDVTTEDNDDNVKRNYWLRILAAFHIVHCDNYPQEMKPGAQQVLHSLIQQYQIPALLRDCIVDHHQQGEQAASNKLQGINGPINSRWLLHFYVTVHQIKDKTAGNSLLSFFVDLFNQPMNLKEKYFPTMPQDPKRNILNQLFIESHDETKETIFFRCANGLHVFGFNEDEIESMPRFCHFCESKQSGDSVGKNVAIKSVADSTEREYALHADDDESMLPESIRNLNLQEILTIRFLMHSAMIISGKKTELLTLIRRSSSSSAVITNEHELDNYLIERLNANFVALNSSLECKAEQTWRILHTILANISSSFEDNHPQQPFDLSLLEGRKLWEDAFSETFVNFSELNSSECSNKYNNIVKKDRKLHSEMLITLNEQSKPIEDERRRFPFIKELWNQRMEISIASFRDIYRTEIAGKCPLLSHLLDHVNTFRVSDKLVSIIDLQNTLVAKFTQQLDPFYLETVSIKEFLTKWFTLSSNGELDCHVQTAVQNYIAVFNQLKLNVFSHSDIGRSAREYYEAHKEKFDRDAWSLPCGFLFPCEYGCGQSAIALRDYLIDYHNAAISLYHTKHSLQQHSDDTLSPCNIGRDHVVCVKMETIESLLLINSDYDFRSSEDINWTVNLDILERQIEIRYFSGRSLIDKTLAPKFNFPLNNSVESRLSLKIKGSLLTLDKQKEIELSLHTVPDICLLLRHCQSLRRLLELTYSPGDGLDESTTLKNYADMIYYCVPPEIERTGILENFTLEYLEDLVLFLCVLRARRMIRLNQNPWIGIIKINYNSRISTAAANFNEKSLNDLLRHIECNRLLCVLFAFSQNNEALKLDDPDASLSFGLYEFAKKHYHQDYAKILRDKIDKSILVKQSVDYFNYIVRKI